MRSPRDHYATVLHPPRDHYASEAVKAAYLTARERLSGVDKLVEVALFAASCSNNQQACSQTSRLGFEALTGGLDMTKAPDNEIRFFVQDKDVQPQLTDKPTVTYVFFKRQPHQ